VAVLTRSPYVAVSCTSIQPSGLDPEPNRHIDLAERETNLALHIVAYRPISAVQFTAPTTKDT
jgi:hypothetical protein